MGNSCNHFLAVPFISIPGFPCHLKLAARQFKGHHRHPNFVFAIYRNRRIKIPLGNMTGRHLQDLQRFNDLSAKIPGQLPANDEDQQGNQAADHIKALFSKALELISISSPSTTKGPSPITARRTPLSSENNGTQGPFPPRRWNLFRWELPKVLGKGFPCPVYLLFDR